MPTELEEVLSPALSSNYDGLTSLISSSSSSIMAIPKFDRQVSCSDAGFSNVREQQRASRREHGQRNPTATEHLVPFSKMEPSIFKTPQLVPVKDLKLLVRDYAVGGISVSSYPPSSVLDPRRPTARWLT